MFLVRRIKMTFKSILFKESETGNGPVELQVEQPGFFGDLNLDQLAEIITSGKDEYDLKPFFYTSLNTVDEIIYRQQIIQDLENPALFSHLLRFAEQIQDMQISLKKAVKSDYKEQRERLFLDAVEVYCKAVYGLNENLSAVIIKSAGMLSFRKYLINYIESTTYTLLFAETNELLANLSAVTYAVRVKDLQLQVRPFSSESDYTAEVVKTFARFKRDPVKDYRSNFQSKLEINEVEASILKGVATIYPELFRSLETFSAKYFDFADETLMRFDREIHFYIAWLQFITPQKQSGLPFCYPEVSATNKEVFDIDGFDVVLANKLVRENIEVVCNSFHLQGRERIIIVSGPNQGGKTTFARTFGQVHYLASIGCSVPGTKASLFLFDQLFTHFEKEESLHTQHSKFEDDLVRIHDSLQKSTSHSIIIMNEILSSTALQDAVLLSKKILQKIDTLDALSVWVTFIDELVLASEKTVSMVGTVVPEKPSERTFKVTRKPADGLAYALSIAEKHQVTYDLLKERIKS